MVSSAALGHEKPPLHTSSNRNALNSGWWSGLDAGCPGEQATDTNTPHGRPPQGSSRAPRCRVGHSHVPGGRAREVRAPGSPGRGLCPQHLGQTQREQGCRCPSRTSSPSHSIGPGGPGGAARLEASPGEAGPSQRTRSSSGEAGGGPYIRQQLWLWGPRLAGWSSRCWVCWRAGKPAGGAGTWWPGGGCVLRLLSGPRPPCGHVAPSPAARVCLCGSPARTGGRPSRESLQPKCRQENHIKKATSLQKYKIITAGRGGSGGLTGRDKAGARAW